MRRGLRPRHRLPAILIATGAALFCAPTAALAVAFTQISSAPYVTVVGASNGDGAVLLESDQGNGLAVAFPSASPVAPPEVLTQTGGSSVAAISPDGRFVAWATPLGCNVHTKSLGPDYVDVVSTAANSVPREITLPKVKGEPSEAVTNVAVSPSGQVLALADYSTDPPPCTGSEHNRTDTTVLTASPGADTFTVVASATAHEPGTLRSLSPQPAATASPDGSTMVLCSGAEVVTADFAGTGLVVRRYPLAVKAPAVVYDFPFGCSVTNAGTVMGMRRLEPRASCLNPAVCPLSSQLITISDGRLTVRKMGSGVGNFGLYPSPFGSGFATGTYSSRGGKTQLGLAVSTATGPLRRFPVPSTLRRDGWAVCGIGPYFSSGATWLSASVVLAWECDGNFPSPHRPLFLNIPSGQWSVGPVSSASQSSDGACALPPGRWLMTYSNPNANTLPIFLGDSLNMQVSQIQATPGITDVGCSPDGAFVYIVADSNLYVAPSDSIDSSAWSY